MNLTQPQTEAKQAFLNKQQDEMLAHYKTVNQSERKAILKQIDSFLSVVSQSEKIFWLKFRLKLVTLNEKPLFPLGQTVMTHGAKEALEDSNQLPFEFLAKHQKGDWGEVCKEDAEENDFSLKNNYRIFSVYRTTKGEKLYVITEATREITTLLLPEEY